MTIEPEKLRKDFPLLRERPDLAYLDSAATTQKPDRVIEAVADFYRKENANVGRGLYDLAVEATDRYSEARKTVAEFAGCGKDEIAFVRGCTEAMNLLASSLPADGRVAVPESAHHSEMLPWRRQWGEERIDYLPVEEGRIDLERASEVINGDHSVVSVSHVSNVFGTGAPVEELAEIAHSNDAFLVLDAAQSVPRKPLDLEEMAVDFAAFSGHKMCGPTGIGALYGRKELLETLGPYQVGGGMVRKVTREDVSYVEGPGRLEAGTQNVAGAIGMAEAARYLEDLGREHIWEHERELVDQARDELSKIDGVNVLSPENASILSFTADWAHPHDIAEALSRESIAVRAGHHCAQPMMEKLGITGTVRASPYLYTNEGEIDRLVKAVEKAREVFS